MEQNTATTIYNLIKSREDGIPLDEIAAPYPPQDTAVLISLAELLADGMVRTEMRGQTMYCIAVEATNESGTQKKDTTKQ